MILDKLWINKLNATTQKNTYKKFPWSKMKIWKGFFFLKSEQSIQTTAIKFWRIKTLHNTRHYVIGY